MFRLIFEAEGYEVVEAAHGEEALEVLGPNPLPDVVITDLAMPVLNGIELIQRLQAQPRTAMLPIVVVSGNPDAERVLHAARVQAVVRKPFDASALADCIRAIASTLMKRAPAA
ncbi:MAG: hypothetical protein NVS1B3_07690 [Candidatus Dormibacteraceae bacterium]